MLARFLRILLHGKLGLLEEQLGTASMGGVSAHTAAKHQRPRELVGHINANPSPIDAEIQRTLGACKTISVDRFVSFAQTTSVEDL